MAKALLKQAPVQHELVSQDLEIPDALTRYDMVSKAAYYIAEKRGFEGNHELEDWYEAEAIINKSLGR